MNPNERAPSIFESFNARALKPSDVAKTFVPPPHFDALTQRRHSLVIGPRGSGKTTLLKMLQPAALEAWNHPRASEYSAAIEFTGIFVPFDRSWRAQIDALVKGTGATSDRSLLGTAAFTAHVYRAVLSAFLSRTNSQPAAVREYNRVKLGPSQHARLAQELYRCWDLEPGPQSLLAVRAALGRRLHRIGSLGRLVASQPAVDAAALLAQHAEMFSSFVDGVSAALDAWEQVLERQEERWGLLFDELELAPTEIKRTLFSSLRSRDPRLLFKLALSPFDGEVTVGSAPEDPQPGQDYDPIFLWYAEKRETLPFCKQLWDSMLEDSGLPTTHPKKALGRSHFESTPEPSGVDSPESTAYAIGTRVQKSFAQLEEIDPTFRRFLESRNLDARHLDKVPPESRPSEIRKIAPLVTARLFFLREDVRPLKKESKRRSRKRLTLYAGWESICAVSEGNPRWFIGLIKPLIDDLTPDRMRVSQSLQAQAIEQAASRYRAVLRTIPVTSHLAAKKSTGLVAILDSLGEYFRREQITAPFSAEPPGSFLVDEDSSNDLINALGQALNAGAFVILDGEAEWEFGLLRGRRLRLSYLLVAHYGAMPRLARSVSLKRILRETDFESRDPVQLSFS